MKKRNRMILAVLFAVLAAGGFPFVSDAKSRTDYISVGLKYGSAAVSECVLKSEDGFQVVTITGDGPEDTLPLPAYREVVAAAENGSISLRDTEGTLLVADLGSTGALMPLNYKDGDGTITVLGGEYRDGIQLTAYKGSSMNVINYLTTDHYLYGVIHAEMSQSFPLEALKAQAVAARSYVGLNKHAHKDYGFDVCTTTHCQVYKGFANEYPKTNQAVDETSGEMIYSEGKVVQAFFSKNSGGHTQNSEDVWSAAEPYLRGVKDEYSPDYPWTATLTGGELKSRLEAAGYNPGTVESVEITGRNGAGAVSELTVRGSGGTVVLKKERVRTVLGASDIKSTMFELSNGGPGGGDDSAALGEVYVSNGSSVRKTTEDVYVLSSSGGKQKVDAEDLYLSNGGKTVETGGSSSGGGDRGTVSVAAEGKVVFSGKGYGHGIGMPQDSAIEMAKQGFDYQEILEYFFTDIEIH